MDNNRFEAYVKVFTDLYSQDKISVKWRKESAGLRLQVNLADELARIDSSFIEEEFLEVAFLVIRVTKEIVIGETPEEIDSNKLDIIRKLFLNDPDFIEYIYIQASSKVSVVENIDYEILTKRSEKNPNEIKGYSSLVNLVIGDSYERGDDSNFKRLLVEVTKYELKHTIKTLQNILEELENLNKKG